MIRLTHQQSLRIAELPEDYRVIGVDRRAPLVRKPSGQVLRIQQDGRLIAANPRLAERKADEADRLVDDGKRPGGGVQATTPYTSVWG